MTFLEQLNEAYYNERYAEVLRFLFTIERWMDSSSVVKRFLRKNGVYIGKN